MSEVQHRPPPRGRGSARGGRGGFGSRGGLRGNRVNGDSITSSYDNQGEMGPLKQQYGDKLKTIKDLFPTWTDEDIVYALDEGQGDVQATIERIIDGSISPYTEVKSKKGDRSRSKVPDAPTEVLSSPGRGRGRGSDIPRGGRGGRATDRGGRPGRGRSGAAPNGQWAAETEWGKKDGTDDSTWEDGRTATPKQDAKAPPAKVVPPPPKQDTWAALLRAPKKATPPPQPPKPAVVEPTPPPPPPPQAQPQPQPPTPQPEIPQPEVAPPEPAQSEPEEPAEPEPTPAPAPVEIPPSLSQPTEPALPEVKETPKPAEPEPESEPEQLVPEPVEQPPAEPEVPEIPEIKTEEPPVETIQTAPQPLTEQNLEKVEDVAPAPPTGTQASTVNSSIPAPKAEEPTPVTPRVRHAGLSTPKIGSARTASFTGRRTLEQQEAVVMPGNHAIDRTIVQFGSLGLNGVAIDDDYEPEPVLQKPETVVQPPQSPPTQPVASLPPASPQPQALHPTQPPQPQVQTPVQPPQVQQPIQPPVQQQVQPQIPSQQQQPPQQEPLPTPRQAPGLPAQPQVQAQIPQQPQQQQQSSPQPPLAPQSMTSQQHMDPRLSSQFNRFGAIDQTQAAQKPYDSFQQHVPQQHTPQTQAAQLPQVAQSQQAQQQSYGYPTHHQQQQHHQQSHPAQAGLGALSSLPDQYSYYNSDINRAGAPGFNYYTNPYSQPTQDSIASLPRAASGMGSAAGETPTQLPTAPSQSASRFSQVGEQTSGHGTPSPGIPTLQPTSQAPNPQQTAAHQQYPMQPYYHPGYYYMNQQFYPTYQTPGFAKQQGLYTQPHQNFQYSDHTSTPAGLGGFGAPTAQGRDSATGVSDYGRGAVSQAQQSHPQHSSANFGGLPNFLNSRGLPEQQQLGAGVGQQQVTQQGQSDDNLKPFGDSKPPTGPASNAGLQGQPRPGSATSGATNLPQQATQPQGGMGYPHNLNHHLHGHQAHQQSQHSVAQGQGYGQYSMYGQYPSQYGATNSRQGASGWGGQYGTH